MSYFTTGKALGASCLYSPHMAIETPTRLTGVVRCRPNTDDGGFNMAASKPARRRLRSNFNLGGEQAEADPLLQDAFVDTGDYLSIASRHDPRCFLIARTGGGKSAALQRLEETYQGHVIRITPEDLSLPYITDLGAIKYLDSLNVNLDLLFIALWKHVLVVEIIRHRYRVDSPAAKQRFLTLLRDQIKRDPAKRAALDYLDEFEGKFWCETDERVREITQQFERRIDAEAKGSVGVKQVGEASATRGTGTTYANEVRSEQVDRFQRIVNETQLARLNKMLSVLDEDVLNDQYYTYIVIDDLDRDWVDERIANDLIRCLFRTVLDLKRVRNLKVLVALRVDIFNQLDFSRLGGQEEKFRSLALRMRWDRDELVEVLDGRTAIAAEREGLDLRHVGDLLPKPNPTRGDPVDYVLDHTLMRPRDALAFMNECLSFISGKKCLSWDDIHQAERAYSEKRLLALRDEWKITFPDVHELLDVFRRAVTPLTSDELARRLDNAMMLTAEREFLGSSWLTPLSVGMWDPSADKQWSSVYGPLTRFLYGLGFLGLQKTQGRQPVYTYDAPDRLADLTELGASSIFHIHPAFRLALDIKEQPFALSDRRDR